MPDQVRHGKWLDSMTNGEMKQFRAITGAVVIATIVVFSTGVVFASSEMKKGNRLYSEEKYAEALENYDLALSAKPEDAVVQYNRAAALYRMEKFTEAEVGFLNSLAMGEDKIEEESAYNAANSKYRLGASIEGADSASAMENYKQASQFYKRAIELAPEDIDAKYNYEFLLKKIKELEEKMKQEKKNDEKPCKDKKKDEQKKEEEKKKDQKKKDEQQKSKGDEKKKDEEKKKEEEKQKTEAEKKEDKEKNDEQKDREEKSSAEKNKEEEKEKAEEKKKKEAKEKEEEEKQKEAESQKTGEEESSDEQSSADSQAAKNETPVGEMTKEEAQILLMGQEEEEERMRAEKRKARSRNRPAVLKDW